MLGESYVVCSVGSLMGLVGKYMRLFGVLKRMGSACCISLEEEEVEERKVDGRIVSERRGKIGQLGVREKEIGVRIMKAVFVGSAHLYTGKDRRFTEFDIPITSSSTLVVWI
jgi:hypothetical protein